MKNGDFKILLEDDTVFEGNLFKKEWGNIPDKLIKSLEFFLVGYHKKLVNFKEYNLVYEVASIMGKQSFISQVLMMGRDETTSTVTTFQLYKQSCETNNTLINQEWKSSPVTGWRRGVSDGKGSLVNG